MLGTCVAILSAAFALALLARPVFVFAPNSRALFFRRSKDFDKPIEIPDEYKRSRQAEKKTGDQPQAPLPQQPPVGPKKPSPFLKIVLPIVVIGVVAMIVVFVVLSTIPKPVEDKPFEGKLFVATVPGDWEPKDDGPKVEFAKMGKFQFKITASTIPVGVSLATQLRMVDLWDSSTDFENFEAISPSGSGQQYCRFISKNTTTGTKYQVVVWTWTNFLVMITGAISDDLPPDRFFEIAKTVKIKKVATHAYIIRPCEVSIPAYMVMDDAKTDWKKGRYVFKSAGKKTETLIFQDQKKLAQMMTKDKDDEVVKMEGVFKGIVMNENTSEKNPTFYQVINYGENAVHKLIFQSFKEPFIVYYTTYKDNDKIQDVIKLLQNGTYDLNIATNNLDESINFTVPDGYFVDKTERNSMVIWPDDGKLTEPIRFGMLYSSGKNLKVVAGEIAKALDFKGKQEDIKIDKHECVMTSLGDKTSKDKLLVFLVGDRSYQAIFTSDKSVPKQLSDFVASVSAR
ncbi:MAG TPA: hypothetical protein PK835_07505 [Caldisericia bacterium]|nr:hypothetical protein [Caldisericia bacterium]HOU08855.1 hypothetical protein [Caldisericia bacterium]HQG60248.1 hypothetical protein [Caldisericia bacterium]HQH48466.1 hypothetical protein [Caldisericia bacterium]HQJ44906.1 hypothetical protein [Caldisericia bacterium]